MIRLLQSSWAAYLLGTAVYTLTTLLTWRMPANLSAVLQRTVSATDQATGPSWMFSNPELDQLISDLKKEKEALATRQSQLREWENRLAAERLEINQVTQAVHRLQEEFDKNVVRVQAEEAINLKRLARTYSAMDPEGAAVIFKQMDDPTLVKILLTMKDVDTAPILEALSKPGEADAKRTAVLVERLRQAIGPGAKTQNPR
jgi:flagellar motility protein MotE (MotC chaperone)